MYIHVDSWRRAVFQLYACESWRQIGAAVNMHLPIQVVDFIPMSSIRLTPSGPLNATVRVPGSKYQANRVLIIAALAEGESVITSVPTNDDIQRVQAGIAALGATVNASSDQVRVHGVGDITRLRAANINVNASGTFARFVSALAALSSEAVVIDGSARMRQRPMADLCKALRSLGAQVNGANDALPLTIRGPLQGGICELPGHISSQYLSALLLASPYAQKDTRIELTSALVSRPFVDMTIDLMRQAGVELESTETSFRIRAGQRYQARQYTLEADPCSASYFLAGAALTGGDVTLLDYNLESVQGEAQFPMVLDKMGCLVKRVPQGLRVQSTGKLKAVEMDMGNMPDVVQTAAVLAAFAEGTSKFTNIGHLVHKESNRIYDTAAELRKMGVTVEATDDALIIEGGQPKGAEIHTHDDHRQAMSFAVAGLKIPNMLIHDADVVGKSFPQFWQTLRTAGAHWEEV